MRIRLCVAALLLAASSASLPCRYAAAQEKDAVTDMARRRFQEGVKFFDQKRYEEARAAFLQAYALKHHPAVLLNLAHSEIKRPQPRSCAALLDLPSRAPSQRNNAEKAEAEKALASARSKLGRIQVSATAGAEILVDGESVNRRRCPKRSTRRRETTPSKPSSGAALRARASRLPSVDRQVPRCPSTEAAPRQYSRRRATQFCTRERPTRDSRKHAVPRARCGHLRREPAAFDRIPRAFINVARSQQVGLARSDHNRRWCRTGNRLRSRRNQGRRRRGLGSKRHPGADCGRQRGHRQTESDHGHQHRARPPGVCSPNAPAAVVSRYSKSVQRPAGRRRQARCRQDPPLPRASSSWLSASPRRSPPILPPARPRPTRRPTPETSPRLLAP